MEAQTQARLQSRPEGLSYSLRFIEPDTDDEAQVREYPWRERYDPAKEYTTQEFTASYDGVERRYRYCCCQMERRGTGVTETWIVAEEQLTEEEQEALAKHCQCGACVAPWWSLQRWQCRCCIGCLHSEFVQQHQIRAAREAIAGKRKPEKRYTPLYHHPIAYIGTACVAAFAVGELLK